MAKASDFSVGQRLSYDRGALCTVRYIGEVVSTTGEWLGVEWDNPTRGKHDGVHKGVRYFQCWSKSPTAASFVRPSRPTDPSRSFLEALRHKYDASEAAAPNTQSSTRRKIVISGKEVQEVGFDKIRDKFAQLSNLKTVILDDHCIDRAHDDASGGYKIDESTPLSSLITETCPSIVDLDISRNLFTNLGVVVEICRQLPALRHLRINGNRFLTLMDDLDHLEKAAPTLLKQAFGKVTSLAIGGTLLPWEETCRLVQHFPLLDHLLVGANQLSHLPPSIKLPISLQKSLRSINLEFNGFTSIEDVSTLRHLENLETLHLKGNLISSIQPPLDGEDRKGVTTYKPTLVFPECLRTVDLSFNRIQDWQFVDNLTTCFPKLTSLRLTHNPLYDGNTAQSTTTNGVDSGLQKSESLAAEGTSDAKGRAQVDEAHMITIGRLPHLQTLNLGNISSTERANSEMFYLSRIAKEMATVPEDQEDTITCQHPRFRSLCELYGEPDVYRQVEANPNTLEERLIHVTFVLSGESTDDIPIPVSSIPDGLANENKKLPGVQKEIIKPRPIPKSTDIYTVKAIAAQLFGIANPLTLQLIWETGEWDPVAGIDDISDDEEDDDGISDTEEDGDGHGIREDIGEKGNIGFRDGKADTITDPQVSEGTEIRNQESLTNTGSVSGTGVSRDSDSQAQVGNGINRPGKEDDMQEKSLPQVRHNRIGGWVRREVALEPGSRQLGYCIADRNARLRIEKVLNRDCEILY